MDLIVVPFLLAAHVPPNTDIPPMSVEPMFMVHVNSKLTIENGNITNHFVSNFLSKIICKATARNKLSCSMKGSKLTVTSTTMSTANPIEKVLEKTTDEIPFDYISNTPIELVFDPFGIMGYNIPEDVHLPKYIIDLLLTIASHVTIGDFYKGGQGSTHGLDTTLIGKCLTRYTLDYRFEMRKLIMPKYKFNLKSISDIEIEEDKVILIKKQRSPGTCHSVTNYMFGINNINTSFPVDHEMKESTTDLLISIQDFGSSTNNRYELYNQDKKVIGNATEFIHLQLDTI